MNTAINANLNDQKDKENPDEELLVSVNTTIIVDRIYHGKGQSSKLIMLIRVFSVRTLNDSVFVNKQIKSNHIITKVVGIAIENNNNSCAQMTQPMQTTLKNISRTYSSHHFGR